MNTRHLKVRKGFRDYYLKDKEHQGNPPTPYLLLKGTWLKQAGFTIDTPVSVTVRKNRLLIAPSEGT